MQKVTASTLLHRCEELPVKAVRGTGTGTVATGSVVKLDDLMANWLRQGSKMHLV